MTAAARPVSSRATWALGFAIAGFVIVALSALAVIFGWMALGEIRRDPELRGEIRAKTAIGLGLFSLVLWVALAPFVL